MSTPAPIVDDGELSSLIETLRAEPVVALDTEFHRERTYFPRIALVQLAWADEVAIVDPTVVDLEPLAAILDGPAVTVIHAASQDLEVLLRACGTVPRELFDTQIAAGFVGMSTPSLSSLVEREFGVRLPKGDRLTDWLQRPLTDAQLDYAASDVVHLIDLWRRLCEQLEERGRLSWAADECELLRGKARVSRPPEDAWQRIKEARQLRGTTLNIAKSVAAWRERRAIEVDQPVRFVMADIAVVTIAQRAPTTADQLRSIRGVDDRHARGETATQLLDAVAEGRAAPAQKRKGPAQAELSRELRPAVGLVSSWISQMARDAELDTTLLATRADLEAFLRDDPDARLATGWRAELVGGPIRRLVEGDASLAFDGEGGLVLEERSRRPITGSAD